MKITDRKPKAVERTAEPDEEKLFEAIVMGKDITEVISTGRGDFTVKYLTFSDIIDIGNIIARRNGGLPAASFSQEAEIIIEQTAYLDVAVVEYPEWFRKARDKNPAFSFADVPDDGLIFELYNRGRQFRDRVLKKIKRKGKPADTRPVTAEAAETALGGGAFEGLAVE